MAGKNESPRQKMIGMMYLVLTALLALQVSSALLYKFEALNTNIEQKVNEATKENKEKKNFLQKEVKRRGNLENEVAAAKKAQDISEKTNEMLSYIDAIKKDLIQQTGGYTEEGSFKGASEETKVEVYMIGASEKHGKAYELKKKLDDYVAFMNSTKVGKFTPLALDAKDDPKLKNNSDQKNKNFAQLNFGQTPMVAALAVLSEIEARIADMETQSITKLYEEIGDIDVEVNKLIPFVRSKSDYVVAGTKYEAELCLAATSTSIKPNMEANGQSLMVNEDGVGKFSFTAQGGTFGEKNSMKKTWTGKIKLKMPNGSDSIFSVTQEYHVVKPVIQVQSAAIQSLYRNCGNKLSIQVPALGADYQPTFEVEGGQLTSIGGAGNVMIIPTGKNVTVRVKNKGTLIGEEKFGVKLVPLPAIELVENNRVINPIDGCPKSAQRIVVRFKPDAGFRELLPTESYYEVVEGSIMLATARTSRGSVPIVKNVANISGLLSSYTPGSRLVVEIKKIKRRNYRGEWEEISFNEARAIPIN
jgi:gliding motility-associated protein GldM